MSGYENCAGCGDPVIRGDSVRTDIFCFWCEEAAKELGIDLESGDVSSDDIAKLVGMRELELG